MAPPDQIHLLEQPTLSHPSVLRGDTFIQLPTLLLLHRSLRRCINLRDRILRRCALSHPHQFGREALPRTHPASPITDQLPARSFRSTGLDPPDPSAVVARTYPDQVDRNTLSPTSGVLNSAGYLPTSLAPSEPLAEAVPQPPSTGLSHTPSTTPSQPSSAFDPRKKRSFAGTEALSPDVSHHSKLSKLSDHTATLKVQCSSTIPHPHLTDSSLPPQADPCHLGHVSRLHPAHPTVSGVSIPSQLDPVPESSIPSELGSAVQLEPDECFFQSPTFAFECPSVSQSSCTPSLAGSPSSTCSEFPKLSTPRPREPSNGLINHAPNNYRFGSAGKILSKHHALKELMAKEEPATHQTRDQLKESHKPRFNTSAVRVVDRIREPPAENLIKSRRSLAPGCKPLIKASRHHDQATISPAPPAYKASSPATAKEQAHHPSANLKISSRMPVPPPHFPTVRLADNKREAHAVLPAQSLSSFNLKQTTPEISAGSTSSLNKIILTPQSSNTEERIAKMLKRHVSHWQAYFQAEKRLNLQEQLLHARQAQVTQKALQKMISCDEVQSHVQGWNPWDEMAKLRPKTAKKKPAIQKRNEQYHNKQARAGVVQTAQAIMWAYNSNHPNQT